MLSFTGRFARGRLRSVVAFGLVLAGVSTALAVSPPRQDEWPGYRGANGDGIAGATSIFAANDKIALKTDWKRAIGSGYSGIAVAEGIVVTMFSDGKSDVAAAFDSALGTELWRFEIEPTYTGHDGSHTGPIATPCISDGRVFGLGAHGRFFALDAKSGTLLWSTHLIEDQKSKKPHYGFATSPMVVDDVVVLQVGGENSAVVGFDVATGERKWGLGTDTAQYQSPMRYFRGNKEQVLAAGDKQLIAVDARAGELLWQIEHGGGGAIGIASASPVPVGTDRLFLSHKGDAATVIALETAEGKVTSKTAWESGSIRNSYTVPVYHDGHIYAYSRRFLTCVDAESGESVWRSRQPGDGFISLVDEHLVIVTKKGSVHLAKASPSGYAEIASLELFDELSWSAPSLANRSIYVRSLSEIAKIDIVRGETVASTKGGPDSNSGKAGRADSKFARFLDEVRRSTDKDSVVDGFMKSINRFPIIEGNDLVHFVYRGPGGDLAVAGDMFGARQEQAMQRLEGTDLFYHSMHLEPDARLNYVFLKDYKQILDPRNPQHTSTTVLGEEMELSFSGKAMEMCQVAMPKWQPPSHLKQPSSEKQGRIETHELESKSLEAKHSVDVYLPAGYKSGELRYPVAFVHDGKGAKENGKYQTSLDNLIGSKVKPIIVVFILDTPRGDPSKYVEMFTGELIPFIDKTYSTQGTPESRANIGMGFPAFNTLLSTFSKPGVVSKLGIQSAFLFSDMKTGVDSAMTSAADHPLEIYLDWGKYDLRNPHEAWDLGEINVELAQTLRDKGYTFTGGQVNDGTGWSSWQNRTDNLFEALFPMR